MSPVGRASLFLLIILTAPTSMPPSAQAGPQPPTNILYGFISTNRTLTTAPPGPIYDVIGDVVINPGVTLTIQPGVMLRASLTDTLQGGGYPSKVEINVRGTLQADASVGDSIRFWSAGASAPGEWGQINVEAGGNVFMRRISLRGAINAITVQGGGSIDLADGVFADCINGLLAQLGGGHVRQCVFRGSGIGSGTGMQIGSSVDTSPFDSTDAVPSTVSNFYFGVGLEAGAYARNLLVRDTRIGINNGGYGARIAYCTVARNLDTGLYTANDGYAINCIATNNGIGIYLTSYVNFCDSWSNSSNFYLVGYGTLGSQIASFNPFFVDAANNDFRLAQGSIFKSFSNSGGEIGAYGPGPGPPVSSRQTSWGRLKALYR